MMSHQNSKSFTDKHNVQKISDVHARSKVKTSHHTTSTAPMKTESHYNLSHRVKRLKTRKERDQIRGQESSRSCRCTQHSRTDGSEKTQRHHRQPLSCSRKHRTFSRPFPSQRPSIITEGRLTSIRGLFSHEVRSVDIERLVSEQMQRERQRNEQRKPSKMHVSSPLLAHLTSGAESDQDPPPDQGQGSGSNTLPQVRTKESSRKYQTGKHLNAFQNGTGASMGSPRVHRKHSRNANSGKKDENRKRRKEQDSTSPRGTKLRVLSSSDNEPVVQLHYTPVKGDETYFDIPETDAFKSHDEEKRENMKSVSANINGFINTQRLENTSTRPALLNTEVPQIRTDPTLTCMTSLSDLDSGAGALADSVKQGEQKSAPVREAVNRLAARLCRSVELPVQRHKRPLLAECREALLQTLQQRHGLQLEHNLRRLHSHSSVKQTATRYSLGKRNEDCGHTQRNHGKRHEDREHSRNMEIWTYNAMRQDYFAEEAKQDLDRGASIKKHKLQSWKTFSPPVSLKEKQHTDLFGQCGAATLSQDTFKVQPSASTQLFYFDQAFTELGTPKPSAPTWGDLLIDPVSQQFWGRSLSRNESNTFGLELISHQLREDRDIMFNLHSEYQSRKPQEASLSESRCWPSQLEVQDVSEKWGPSASFPREGFQYEPFFRFPHPSYSEHTSNLLNMNLYPRANQPDRPFYLPPYP